MTRPLITLTTESGRVPERQSDEEMRVGVVVFDLTPRVLLDIEEVEIEELGEDDFCDCKIILIRSSFFKDFNSLEVNDLRDIIR